MKAVCAGLLLSTACVLAAADYKVLNKFAVPGTGGWDYLTLDAPSHRLYISHGTQVDVLDVETGKLVGTISDTPGVHGIALSPESKHGFTSNGRENKVSMFDISSLKLIKKIDVGRGPDGIYYDSATKRVFTNNHGSDDISVIDAEKGEVVGTIKAEGGGEQAIKAKDGLFYVNIEDKAEVLAFDPKTMEVKKRYPIGAAKTPTGLAYSPKTNHLFIGCRETPTMVVMDAGTGRVVKTFPIGPGVDWAEFDAASSTVFTSNGGDGTISTFREKSTGDYEDTGRIQTQVSAKTMALDQKAHRIYLPAAEYNVTPAEPGKKAGRTVKPGSFVVLVVGQ